MRSWVKLPQRIASALCSEMIFWIFLIILTVRSSLDALTDERIGALDLNVASILGLVIVLLAATSAFTRRRRYHKTSQYFLTWLLSLVPCVVLALINFHAQGLPAVREWVRLASIFSAFNLSYSLTTAENARTLLGAIYLSLVIPLLVGAYQMLTGAGYIVHEGFTRVYATFYDANAFALYLVFFTFLIYWRWEQTKGLLWAILLVGISLVLVRTYVFTAFVVLLVAWLFFAKGRTRVAVGVAVVVLALILSGNQTIRERVFLIQRINLSSVVKYGQVVDSFSWRIVNWLNLVDLWSHRPLLGYGLQTVSIINPWIVYIPHEGYTGYAAHNDFLRYLVETGVVGLCLYILFIIRAWMSVSRAYKSCVDYRMKSLLRVLLAMFFGWVLGSVAESYIGETAFQLYFWSVLGASLKVSDLLAAKQSTM